MASFELFCRYLRGTRETEMVICYQNCSRDKEKLLKSLEQIIQTVQAQNNI